MVLLEYPPSTEDREILIAQARSRCAICGHKSDRLVIDHDHDTGVIRGVLCIPCNSGLGFLNDNPQVTRRATEYLLRWKPDHDNLPVDASDIIDLPNDGICLGGDEPILNLNTVRGPAQFRCGLCDRANIKAKMVGRRGGVRIYKPLAHLSLGAPVKPGRGPAKQQSVRW